MQYPLISEYIEAIRNAEDNFDKLSNLRPVLDDNGHPIMSSGNFAVVFKMRDENTGKLYAVKCFTREQEHRNENYQKIAEELEFVTSSYFVHFRFMEKELFVDTTQSEEEEFPVLVMDWVDGLPLDVYLRDNIFDDYERRMLAYRFCRMGAWLLSKPFAHGDLKPDNILVKDDGTLVLVDYDGMFVPSMKGQKAQELGSPDFRHPLRTENDFDEHIDDFAIASIALSLKAISLDASLYIKYGVTNKILFSEKDHIDLSKSVILSEILALVYDAEMLKLFSLFFLASATGNLEIISFRTLFLNIPVRIEEDVLMNSKVTDEERKNAIKDECGVLYTVDGKKLIGAPNELKSYKIKKGTVVIADEAFACHNPRVTSTLREIFIPDSVKSVGNDVFHECESLERINIPCSITYIGKSAFYGCSSLKDIYIPHSITSIEDYTFGACHSLRKIHIPNSVTTIGGGAFSGCFSLDKIHIPNSVTKIGNFTFSGCAFEIIQIPDSIESIGNGAFSNCNSLREVDIPNSLKVIGDEVFWACNSLRNISIPNSVTYVGTNPFVGCKNIKIHCNNEKYVVVDGLLLTREGKIISCFSNEEIINLPDTVTSIGDKAFRNCSSLREIHISNSVTSIGNNAFGYCKSLHKIHILGIVASIGNDAFEGCNTLQKIIIPKDTLDKFKKMLCNVFITIEQPKLIRNIRV